MGIIHLVHTKIFWKADISYRLKKSHNNSVFALLGVLTRSCLWISCSLSHFFQKSFIQYSPELIYSTMFIHLFSNLFMSFIYLFACLHFISKRETAVKVTQPSNTYNHVKISHYSWHCGNTIFLGLNLLKGIVIWSSPVWNTLENSSEAATKGVL